MRCILVYKEDYPWDVRVEKIAKSLGEAGHDVTILCSNLGRKDKHEQCEHFDIRRLPSFKGLPDALVKWLHMPFWFNPVWLWAIFSITAGQKGVIIVRDLPLIKAGIWIGKMRRWKVILDMAECYPEMYASMAQFGNDSLKTRLTNRLLKSPSVAARYEKKTVPQLDHTLVMIEESRDRLLRLGTAPERVTIVSNTPPLDKFGHKTVKHESNDIRLVYVGFLTRIRGLDILIRGIRKFIDRNESNSKIRFDIVGKGAAKPALQSLVSELGLEENVIIHGWLDQTDVEELMDQANVGALTYRVCGHWNHTIPNKIFDYMLAGLPVLATEVVPIARIIRESDCGVVCRDQNVDDVAANLLQLRDPDLRQKLGQNGNRSIQETYNWENDEAKLREVIDQLDLA
ncbi:glycosyltransferase family 4 protein [Hydrocarboniclastica marina]|uniref:Glycosyltransferase WbuB n=1 Tax=Hydrocarboniclastica marina TaxID=2259620 RepID=A0A4P7XHP1_9ALTE|nr:glycosyltransferase family 4 protein [Hydrocarboniclastica marina]QCF26285.1 glycosyltransferase WbuB [Hydrocarboniclastica marina]